jgi:cation-transporting ATPase E
MDAINLFHKNNIEIKILSGDNAASIQAVAREIGWNITDNELISGSEIDDVKDEDFFSTITKKKIFARLKPDHKLRIIKTLRKNKIYTAMIGDGVNDLPAIKESDMGIAMEEGSKITKEVADIVLLKNKFSLLPNIFDEGNKIVNTVSDTAKLFLTKNFMVIYLSLISLVTLFEFPLTPRRASLITVFSISLPALIIALKNSNVSKMKNFTKELISFVALSALIIVAGAYIGQYYAEKISGVTIDDIQMIMLSVLIVTTAANFLSVTLRKESGDKTLYIFYAGGIVGLYLLITLTNIDFFVLNWLKIFYEIIHLKAEFVPLVLMVSFASSVVLILLQWLRKRFIN